MTVEVVSIKTLSNKRLSITVVCPKCGRPGTLRIDRRNMFGDPRRFQVIHGNESRKTTCSFGWNSDEYDELYRIYSIKEEDHGENV